MKIHISRTSYIGMVDNGRLRMPTTLHLTYCWDRDVPSTLINNNSPTCEECMDSKAWEEIDEGEV
jgi:hypothetical protein